MHAQLLDNSAFESKGCFPQNTEVEDKQYGCLDVEDNKIISQFSMYSLVYIITTVFNSFIIAL